MLKIKRAYDAFQKSDGHRILIDRLWPRGVSKQKAHIDEWLKEVAPSDRLRKKFHHEPKHWKEFQSEYLKELRASEAREELERIAKLASQDTVTLIYGARDEKLNNAVVLQKRLQRMLGKNGKKKSA